MRVIKILKLLAIFLFFLPDSNAQEGLMRPDTLHKRRTNFYKALGITTVYYGGSMYILGKTWYKDRAIVPFHFYNDNAAYLQVDKFGHAFGSYVYSYVGFHYLKSSGLSRKESLAFGATLGFVLQLPVEIMDGIHEGYGFSPGDLIANTFGSALVLGQELLFREQIIKYKFSYSKSEYFDYANGYLGNTAFEGIFKDYNGHTYWLSFPVEMIIHDHRIPSWLNVAVGYSANGMYGEFENLSSYNGVDIPETIRYRQYLLSLDIDWTRIKSESAVVRGLLKGLTFIKLPFPALEYNATDQLRWHWLYF